MGFPRDVKDRAAVACNRSCCLCHNFKGLKLEFHHIKQEADGGDNSFENCIPLCFDCHADMGGVNKRHPKGNSYSEQELRDHRDKWYRQCAVKDTVFVEASDADIDALFSPQTEATMVPLTCDKQPSAIEKTGLEVGLRTFAEELRKALPSEMPLEGLQTFTKEAINVLSQVTYDNPPKKHDTTRKKIIHNSDPHLSDRDDW